MSLRLKAGEHSCFGRFEAGSVAVDKSFLDRPALLVYCGTFDSMDGPVTVTEDHLDLLVQNHNGRWSKVKRLVNGEIPVQSAPPLQLDHSTKSADTVGRVIGQIYKKEFTDDEGIVHLGVFTDKIRVLGSENVIKVEDGRWGNVSIGADLATGKLNELSITPFPAAVKATILSAKGQRMNAWEKFKSGLAILFKLSAGPAVDDKADKMKKHLMDKAKCSSEDAEKKLSEMNDDEKTSMSKEIEEKDRLAAEEVEKQRLAAEKNTPAGKGLDTQEKDEPEHKFAARVEAEVTKRLAAAAPSGAKLSAENKTKFVALASGIKTGSLEVQLSMKKARLNARLSGLRASAKITPAEVKKIDIAKLSAETDKTIDAVFKSYEDREPVIMVGILGTGKAENLSKFAAEFKRSKLEEESRNNMPSKKAALAKAEKDGTTAPVRFSSDAAMEKLVAEQEVSDSQYRLAYAEVEKAIDSGDKDAAKGALNRLAKLKTGFVDEPVALSAKESETQLAALAKAHETLQNQFQELLDMAGTQLGVSKSEIDKGV